MVHIHKYIKGYISHTWQCEILQEYLWIKYRGVIDSLCRHVVTNTAAVANQLYNQTLKVYLNFNWPDNLNLIPLSPRSSTPFIGKCFYQILSTDFTLYITMSLCCSSNAPFSSAKTKLLPVRIFSAFHHQSPFHHKLLNALSDKIIQTSKPKSTINLKRSNLTQPR